MHLQTQKPLSSSNDEFADASELNKIETRPNDIHPTAIVHPNALLGQVMLILLLIATKTTATTTTTSPVFSVQIQKLIIVILVLVAVVVILILLGYINIG